MLPCLVGLVGERGGNTANGEAAANWPGSFLWWWWSYVRRTRFIRYVHNVISTTHSTWNRIWAGDRSPIGLARCWKWSRSSGNKETSCSKSRERKRLQEEAKLLLPSSVIFAISIHPSIKMIFGSKALSVAVLSALVFSEEASAATAKKGKHNNKTLRKADRKLKGSRSQGKVSKVGCRHISFQVCKFVILLQCLQFTPKVGSQIFVFVYFHRTNHITWQGRTRWRHGNEGRAW